MTGWLALVASAIPPLLAASAKFISDGHDGARVRRIKRYVELLQSLPESADAAPIVGQLNAEVTAFADGQARLSSRKLDGSTVAALVFVGIMTAGLTWAGVYGSLNFHWLIWLPTGLVAACGVALMAVGVGQLYKYPSP
jgi:hypothetical protein